VKGIEGFSAKPLIAREPRGVPSCTAMQAHDIGKAFGGYLDGLAGQDGQAASRLGPPSFYQCVLPTPSGPGVLPSAGNPRGAKPDGDGQRAEVPSASSKIALARNETAAILPDGEKPEASGPAGTGCCSVSPVRPVPAEAAAPAALPHSSPGVSFPNVFISPERGRAQGAKAGSAEAVPARRGNSSRAARDMEPAKPLGSVPGTHGTQQLPGSPVSAVCGCTANGREPVQMQALLTASPVASAPAGGWTPAAASVSCLAPVAGSGHAPSPAAGLLRPAAESALDSAAAAEADMAAMNLAEEGGSNKGQNFSVSGQARVVVISQETHLAPAIISLPGQQVDETAASMQAEAADAGGSAHPSFEVPPSAHDGSMNAAIIPGAISTRADTVTGPKGGHELSPSAAPAPASGLPVTHSAALTAFSGFPPAQQIGEYIARGAGVSNANGNAVQPSSVLSPPVLVSSQPPMPRVQIMQLQLDPANLGKVSISIRLSGMHLDLHVVAERPETVQLVRNDKDGLADKLQAAGYSLESLSVQGPDIQAPQQQPGTDGLLHSQSQATTGQANGGPLAHDRPSTQDNRQRSRLLLADDHQDGGELRPTGDLYI